MNELDKKYQELLQDILDNGVEKKDRTGTGTLSVFGRQIRHKMSEGYPLLTTKKMYFKGIVIELLWFLRGDTNIKFLHDNNCHIWDGDYEKSGRTDGELGPIYGKQWRDWNGKPEQITDYKGGEINPYFCDCQETFEDGHSKVRKKNKGIDQIQNSINLLKTDPDSRRNIVSAWNVGELDQMTLPPCHYGFQVYTRELSDEERLDWMKKNRPKTILPMRDPNVEFSMDEWFRPYNVPKRAISLMWNQRSVDTFLGLPFNIASYGLLLEIIAKEVNMVPDELIGNLGDVHLYKNHIEQAKEQIGREWSMEEKEEWCRNNSNHMDCPMYTREPMKLPTLNIVHNIDLINIKDGKQDRFEKAEAWIEGYQSHPTIKAPLNN